ncbi:hypothetical protein DOTSEDRAFT_69427 [Lecanosticta acicola]|uniref:BZIP domain-containing protein n=1 Tax=Lecanosticta acicola TaxID=111012 RepID=A0AAI8YS70_9PEZI|nr:hypothetical protein DOTSEDRAFT_69427 [Lecanosticta acicola]
MYSPRRGEAESAASAVTDSVFEPPSGFMFDDETALDAEEISNMQRNIASLNVMNHNDSGFPTMGAMHGNGMSEQFSPGFVNPFLFDQVDVSPDSPSWHAGSSTMDMRPQSMQEDIVNSRGASVAHHYGQVTPPDDSTPKAFSSMPTQHQPTPPAQSIPNAKSERARNAANQRHAKAKKARKDSGRSAGTPDDEGDEVEDKRERYREKNRVAAAKCRAKKKVNTDDLEQSAREVTAKNTRLKAEERELRDLFSSLRDQALAHDPTQGCTCQTIHQYNRHKAQETARGVMTGFGVQSPSQQSADSGSPSTIASSRTHSFSGGRSQSIKHPARAQSMVSAMGFAPPGTTTGDMMRQGLATASDGDGFSEYLHRSSDVQQGGFI